MIRTRKAGTKTLLIALTAAAIVSGSAAAAIPTLRLPVQARLAPAAGTSTTGRFNGTLGKDLGVVPRIGLHWHLTWTLRLPSLGKPIDASLRIRGDQGGPPVTYLLCTRCATTTRNTLTLTGSEALRVAQSDSLVVVRSRTETLRGVVRAARGTP